MVHAAIGGFICTFAPEGIPLVVLQAALATPPFDQTSYGDQLIDLAVRLVLNGHQRSPGQILQEMGALSRTLFARAAPSY
jgi:hypothetical protein